MNDNYLWDRSGTDETVEKLESLLAPASFAPARTRRPAPPAPGRRFPLVPSILIVAASLLLVAGLFTRRVEFIAIPSEARTVDLGRYGEVRAEAGTVLRTIRLSDEEIRLRLERGTIHASITLEARPRLVQVETPATTCIDLGCHYTLTVDPRGRTTVHVETGRVAFQDRGREVFVPAGASCRAEPGSGSGTPHWDDAPAALVEAIHAYDVSASERRREAAVELCRRASTPRDALTIWHLLQDADRRTREVGLNTLENLAGRPGGVSRQSVLDQDPAALEAWKQHLDLDPFGGFR